MGPHTSERPADRLSGAHGTRCRRPPVVPPCDVAGLPCWGSSLRDWPPWWSSYQWSSWRWRRPVRPWRAHPGP